MPKALGSREEPGAGCRAPSRAPGAPGRDGVLRCALPVCSCPGARESRCVTGADARGSWGLPAPADSSESPAVQPRAEWGRSAGRGPAGGGAGRLRCAELENPKKAAAAGVLRGRWGRQS